MRILVLGCVILSFVMFGERVSAQREGSPDEFHLRNGDHVVFLGNGLIEQAQKYGFWEASLIAAHPEKKLTFRNLGWSGDSVWAESRGLFDAPEKGYERMLAHIKSEQPTLIVLFYGNNEAFAGMRGLPAFVKQYEKLIGDLKAETGARLVLAEPLPPLSTSNPLISHPPQYLDALDQYTQAIRRLSEKHACGLLNWEALTRREQVTLALNKMLTGSTADLVISADGLRLNENGYHIFAQSLVETLTPEKTFENVTTADEFESLRQAVIAKNQLYFHRWRPQNFTYLYGFRKHEQGQNSAEIPLFDPEIKKLEEQIAAKAKALQQARRSKSADESRDE